MEWILGGEAIVLATQLAAPTQHGTSGHALLEPLLLLVVGLGLWLYHRYERRRDAVREHEDGRTPE